MIRDRAARLGRKLRRVFEPRAVVLVYHRVAELDSDPFSLAVRPARFAEHLRVLRERYVPLRLLDLVAGSRRDAVGHRGVAVTFDDGYADNFHAAKPLLEAAGVPATTFVVAGKVGSGEEFWWDRLDRLVLRAERLPRRLSLEIDAGAVHWDTAGLEKGLGRHAVFSEIWSALRDLSEAARTAAIDRIAAQIDEAPVTRRQDLPLAAEELAGLARGGLVEIGAHGSSHARLAGLSAEAQREEIRASRQRLRELTESDVAAFAYPYGQPGDYTRETAAIVAEEGFACACANVSGWVVAGVDPFAMPRLRVFDWDGEELARRLRRFLWA